MANEVELELGIDTKALVKVTKEVEKSVNDLGKSIENTFKDSNRSLETFKGTLAGIAAFKATELIIDGFRSMGRAISESIDIAAGKEAELKKLENALIRTGLGGRQAVNDFDDFANEIEKTTKFTDDAALSSITLLANLTKLDNAGIKVATKAASELAAVLGTDLDSATRILIKATEGNVTALQRQGITIEKGKTNAETYANTLKAVSKFSGAASADLNTFSGSMGQFGKAVENVQESLGNLIIKNPKIIGLIKALTGEFDSLDGSIKDSSKTIVDFSSSSINFLLAFGVATLDTLDVLARGFRGIGVTILNVLSAPITLASKAIVAFVENAGAAVSLFDEKLGASISGSVSKLKLINEATTKALDISEAFSTDSVFGELSKGLDKIALKTNEFYIDESEKSKSNANGRVEDEKLASEQILQERAKLQADLFAIQQQVAAEQEIGRQIEASGQLTPEEEAQAVLAREQLKIDAELTAQIEKNKLLKDVESQRLADKIAHENAMLKSTQNLNKYQSEEQKRNQARELQDKQTFYSSAISLSNSNNKSLAAIGKAFAIQQATIQGYEAIQSSYRFGAMTGGPFLGATFAAIAAAATAANIAKIAGVNAFEKGGIVPGNSFTGDNVQANLNSGEAVLTRSQQTELFKIANGSGGNSDALIGAISSLGDRIERMNITVVANGRELARLMREESRSGFAF